MGVAFGRGARRELAFIVALAAVGVALVSLVAFTPWYDPWSAQSAGSITDNARQLMAALALLLR